MFLVARLIQDTLHDSRLLLRWSYVQIGREQFFSKDLLTAFIHKQREILQSAPRRIDFSRPRCKPIALVLWQDHFQGLVLCNAQFFFFASCLILSMISSLVLSFQLKTLLLLVHRHVVFGIKPPRQSYHLFGSLSKSGDKNHNVTLVTGVAALCQAIWLTRNDKVFNKCHPQMFLQVLFRGT